MINNDTLKTWNKDALILTGALLLIVKTEYYWKQIGGLVPLVVKIIIVMLAAGIVVMMILTSKHIYKESGPLKVKMFLPLFIYVLGLSFSFTDPLNFNAENFQSKVILKGHFKAEMRTATITFRRNGHVEFEGTGFFKFTFYYGGTWTRSHDTLRTTFGKDAPIPWGDQLVVYPNDKLLLPLDTIAATEDFPGFLLDEGTIDVESFHVGDHSTRIL
ncbi:MAG: hypothetical protein NTX44_00410 [Ignavibacteriales bacterium]|nr:hypothetical protein [Ignavibacteriales bacterium]